MAITFTPTTLRADAAPLQGMMLAATAFALLTSVDTIFKLMAAGYPAYQILLVNGVFSIVPIVAWALLTGGLNRLYTGRPVRHLARGGVSVVSAFCAIYAYSRLPLADFYAIVFSGPLIVTALSFFFLGEKVDRGRWLAIFVGFFGVMLVTQPFAVSGAPGADQSIIIGRCAALLSVFCYSLSVTLVRRMRVGESNIAFSFYGYVVSILVGGAIFILFGGLHMSANDIAHLMMSGCLGGISSICLMTAYHRSPVAVVAPFQYTQIFWGALAGWLLWRQVPSHGLIAGALIVAASGLYVIYHEIRIGDGRKPG